MLYRIGDSDAVVDVATTSLPDEELNEERIESWVAQRPDLLGETLLIIGRQIELDGGRDRIDLLAVDPDGALVVIELKRDLIGGSADLQALRYAALVSDWKESDIRRQAEGYWQSTHQDRDFRSEVEQLCEEEVELNASQRIILVGRDIKPRLGSMALWLIGQGVDVRVVAVSLLRDEDRLYLQPQIVIPPPTEKSLQGKVGIGASKKPWLIDGQDWHLHQRSGPIGKAILESLVALIGEAVPDAEGPSWGQKFYVSWKSGQRVWAAARPGGKRVSLQIAKAGISAEDAAERLGYVVFDESAELSDKFALGSSAGPRGDGLRLLIKSQADVEGDKAEALAQLLVECWAHYMGDDAAPASQADSPLDLPTVAH